MSCAFPKSRAAGVTILRALIRIFSPRETAWRTSLSHTKAATGGRAFSRACGFSGPGGGTPDCGDAGGATCIPLTAANTRSAISEAIREDIADDGTEVPREVCDGTAGGATSELPALALRT